MDMFYFMYETGNYFASGNVRQKHCNNSYPDSWTQIASLCIDGQGSVYSLAKYAIVHGKNYSVLLRIVELHAMLKYVFALY
jgi:hypothetical protein